jgi:hypothetical protein
MIDPIAHPEVDYTDPLVALMAWLLTFMAGHVPWMNDRRHLLPTVAVLSAIGVRAGLDVTTGEPLTAATVARGFAAGATAVLADVQRRQLDKARKEKR